MYSAVPNFLLMSVTGAFSTDMWRPRTAVILFPSTDGIANPKLASRYVGVATGRIEFVKAAT